MHFACSTSSSRDTNGEGLSNVRISSSRFILEHRHIKFVWKLASVYGFQKNYINYGYEIVMSLFYQIKKID